MDIKGLISEPFEDYLVPGNRYRVTRSFLDAGKSVHKQGETWTYLGYCPNGFAETTYIYISNDKNSENGFGIDWNSSENNLGLGNIKEYVKEI